jgi:SAM-dependent methyltransferase
MSWLTEYGEPVGLDLSSHALGFCKQRGHRRICMGSVMAIPFPEKSFDIVLSLDVLYFARIKDEVALQEFRRVVEPGGRVVLRVPAYDWLRSAHDRRVSTGHRYSLRELRTKLERNGLEPELLTYVNTFLFPMALLKRVLEKWLPLGDTSEIGMEMRPLDVILRRLLLLESHMINKHSLPFGLSIMGVGRRR